MAYIKNSYIKTMGFVAKDKELIEKIMRYAEVNERSFASSVKYLLNQFFNSIEEQGSYKEKLNVPLSSPYKTNKDSNVRNELQSNSKFVEKIEERPKINKDLNAYENKLQEQKDEDESEGTFSPEYLANLLQGGSIEGK